MSRIANRSAPALNERAFADAMITPDGFDSASDSTTADSSARSCGVQVFTGLPGTSSQIVRTLSASVVVRIADSMISAPFRFRELTPFQQDRRPLPATDA